MNKEWGTPISKDKIIYRRNKLIEWQKIGELRFTPLYEIIDENILDINYMIYEIDRLNNIINQADTKNLELIQKINKIYDVIENKNITGIEARLLIQDILDKEE